MNRRAWLPPIVGLALVATGAAGGYWYATQRAMTATKETASDATDKRGPNTGRKVLYWHDPMVPGHRFDKPGKSPFMDMDLVPVYADAAGAEGVVAISPRVAQNLGVRTAEVKEGRMDMGFTTVGTIDIDERTLVAISPRVAGYVEKLHVRAQYDRVTRGQRLADIYAPEWLAAQEEFLALKRSSQPGAEALAQAARQRLLLLGLSEAQVRAIEESGQPQPRVTVFAPESGVVWELGVREGLAVNPATTLFKLAGLGSVWVHAEVPESEAARVRAGVPVQARVAAMPERVFKGRVATLLPAVSPETRTIRARIVLSNPGAVLKPGMYATLSFGIGGKPALMVPSEAVIRTGKRSVVILAETGGRFRAVEVEPGAESGDMTEMRKGLSAGQKVVVSGQFLIDSEASLKSALTRLEAAETPSSATRTTAGEARHVGHGRVDEVNAREGRIDLSHGPIPSMKWPPMTMGFLVQDKSQLAGIKPGDEIEFEMRGEPADGDYVITRITRKAGAAGK